MVCLCVGCSFYLLLLWLVKSVLVLVGWSSSSSLSRPSLFFFSLLSSFFFFRFVLLRWLARRRRRLRTLSRRLDDASVLALHLSSLPLLLLPYLCLLLLLFSECLEHSYFQVNRTQHTHTHTLAPLMKGTRFPLLPC